jgi:hypothetical protein
MFYRAVLVTNNGVPQVPLNDSGFTRLAARRYFTTEPNLPREK